MAELIPHHVGTADRPAQHVLVDDGDDSPANNSTIGEPTIRTRA
ncbi:hypothetical protein [Micromonospora sp. NPDC049497]